MVRTHLTDVIRGASLGATHKPPSWLCSCMPHMDLDDHADELTEIDGIGERRAEQITERLEECIDRETSIRRGTFTQDLQRAKRRLDESISCLEAEDRPKAVRIEMGEDYAREAYQAVEDALGDL